jgi:hypothetical protein
VVEVALCRIRANHFGSNAALGRVLRKVGMIHMNTRPNYYEKWGKAEDQEEYVLPVLKWRTTAGGSPSDFREPRTGELPRTPSGRSSGNDPRTKFGKRPFHALW